jgi:two-component system, OmpR family, response regulator
MWRCLIVEDDLDNARYIADGLREFGHVAVTCHDGPTALARATGESWDLIVLDRMLPNNVDGLAILAHLRALGKATPVLVLSALSALDERVRGLKAGGDDYLGKPFAFSELAARAEALVRRSRSGPPIQVLVFGDLSLDLASRRAERAGRAIALQPREFRLLAYLMAHAGQLVTRTMLLEAVWDLRFDPGTNVIDVQISRLRGKLDAVGTRTRIQTVRGAGYRMADGEEEEQQQPAGPAPAGAP